MIDTFIQFGLVALWSGIAVLFGLLFGIVQ